MSLDAILADIRACRACAGELPHAPRPVVHVSRQTRILICGAAPGRRVHESGLPFDDPSGDRLRGWMGIDRATFYGHPGIGVAGQAFCYPGTDADRRPTIHAPAPLRRRAPPRCSPNCSDAELTLLGAGPPRPGLGERAPTAR